jgi:ABC-type nickel/cobalt efflux system permease component RcnA
VPCPAGLAIILIGLQYPQRLLFALALLVCFALGLGSVLIAIGVFLVGGKALAAASIEDGACLQRWPFLRDRLPRSFLAALDRGGGKLFRFLPALSSLFIAGLGAFFCVSAFRHGRVEIAAILEHAAAWLR